MKTNILGLIVAILFVPLFLMAQQPKRAGQKVTPHKKGYKAPVVKKEINPADTVLHISWCGKMIEFGRIKLADMQANVSANCDKITVAAKEPSITATLKGFSFSYSPKDKKKDAVKGNVTGDQLPANLMEAFKAAQAFDAIVIDNIIVTTANGERHMRDCVLFVGQ